MSKNQRRKSFGKDEILLNEEALSKINQILKLQKSISSDEH
mgnify:CR=1 FL=1